MKALARRGELDRVDRRKTQRIPGEPELKRVGLGPRPESSDANPVDRDRAAGAGRDVLGVKKHAWSLAECFASGFTGSGMKPAGPSHGKVSVIGKAGEPINFPSQRTLARPGLCSSLPTIPTGTIGVLVSIANRMNPSPNS